MRTAFITTLLECAQKNRKIIVLTADLGFSVFEEYIKELPDQYINVGVAEQNMTGVAAGLAMEGFIPFIYSIVPFATMRNFEQIRNDICYQNLNVKIVGVGAGFSYGPYGHTHHGLEDIGILRTLPQMTIIAPGDPTEVRLATRAITNIQGPFYLRIGKAGEPVLYEKDPKFEIGKGIVLSEGNDISIIATSTMVGRAIEIGQELTVKGISCEIISMHTIKPIDIDLVLKSVKKTRRMVSLEEHSVIGGLGSAISEILAESGLSVVFRRLAVPDHFTKAIGLQEYMREQNGLGKKQIIKIIESLLAQKAKE